MTAPEGQQAPTLESDLGTSVPIASTPWASISLRTGAQGQRGKGSAQGSKGYHVW